MNRSRHRYEGVVKSRGEFFGWIGCEATFGVYGKDVYVGKRDIDGLVFSQMMPGSVVNFAAIVSWAVNKG